MKWTHGHHQALLIYKYVTISQNWRNSNIWWIIGSSYEQSRDEESMDELSRCIIIWDKTQKEPVGTEYRTFKYQKNLNSVHFGIQYSKSGPKQFETWIILSSFWMA